MFGFAILPGLPVYFECKIEVPREKECSNTHFPWSKDLPLNNADVHVLETDGQLL